MLYSEYGSKLKSVILKLVNYPLTQLRYPRPPLYRE